MTKFFLIFCMIGLVFCCKAQQKALNLIVYTEFENPQSTYDSIVDNVINQQLADSIRIIGCPLNSKLTEIQIDSLKLKEFGITEDMVWEKIATAQNPDNINELMELKITRDQGQEIPINSFISFYYITTYYKPEIYITEPSIFFFKNRRAVKIQFYYKQGVRNQLIDFIQKNIDKFSNTGIKTEYEFLN